MMSFDHCRDNHANYMNWRNIINREEATKTYIDNYLVPFLNRYKDNPYLFAIDLCNEPEWISENAEDGKLPVKNLQRFFSMCAAAVHHYSKVPVTIGSACIKWNSDNKGYVGNYWKNEALQAAWNDPKAYLDFYCVHYYGWVHKYFKSPYEMSPADYGINDRPVIIEEAPAKDAGLKEIPVTLTEAYEKALEKGYQGNMPWTSNGVDSNGDITTVGPAALSFSKNHPELVHPGGEAPIRYAIAGMTHDHIGFILNRKDKGDILLTGVYEPNRELAERYAQKFGFDPALIYTDLDSMLDKVRPEAVFAFGSVYDHLKVVEACAPREIQVMVEKPLAVNGMHAARMNELAQKYGIHVLTDFETSWYPSTVKAWQLVNDSNFTGNVRRVVIHDGHQGPVEIGCSKEFLEWLTDPVLNGGGAVMDFGCYGANLMTYLMKGRRPVSVTAVTRQFKPGVYPKVDDDATIIVSYPDAECIIQASWNWPFGRKDMEIYGADGYILALNNKDMVIRTRSTRDAKTLHVDATDVRVYEDPFSYFAAVVRGRISMSDYDPYSLVNNTIVMEILDAARESAATGKTVMLKAETHIQQLGE